MNTRETHTLNCNGKLLCIEEAIVMGILNLTPDSFFDGGKYANDLDILQSVEKMLHDGATIIDIGAVSSKPNANEISEAEEYLRLIPTLKSIVKHFPDTIISIDTFRSEIAKQAIENGASIINDIYAATYDEQILRVCAEHNIPIILMHMQGNPQTMQKQPTYDDVSIDVMRFFIERLEFCRQQNVHDIIIDVGFGFGKTLEHNYTLLKNLASFKLLGKLILAGISRKSMIYKLLDSSPEFALNGTSILNMIALQNGANILRVHDVKEAMECIKIYNYYASI
jgi:dihydropteroate synthase